MSVENTSKQIEVVTYNPDWPSDFEKEAASIKEALGDNSIEIHHIGSTSVPGLAAKPIIDIIGLVQSISKAIKQLNKIGYENRGEMFLPFREYFRKGKGINLHIYENSSPEIELNLLFRDYLRSHPEQAKEYTQLKYNLLKEKLSFEKIMGY